MAGADLSDHPVVVAISDGWRVVRMAARFETSRSCRSQRSIWRNPRIVLRCRTLAQADPYAGFQMRRRDFINLVPFAIGLSSSPAVAADNARRFGAVDTEVNVR